jgi:hypothetical protein
MLCALTGNDFVPSLACLRIADGACDLLVDMLRRHRRARDGRATTTLRDTLVGVLGLLADAEDALMVRADANYFQRARYVLHVQRGPPHRVRRMGEVVTAVERLGGGGRLLRVTTQRAAYLAASVVVSGRLVLDRGAPMRCGSRWRRRAVVAGDGVHHVRQLGRKLGGRLGVRKLGLTGHLTCHLTGHLTMVSKRSGHLAHRVVITTNGDRGGSRGFLYRYPHEPCPGLLCARGHARAPPADGVVEAAAKRARMKSSQDLPTLDAIIQDFLKRQGQVPEGPLGGASDVPEGPLGGDSDVPEGPLGGASDVPEGPLGGDSDAPQVTPTPLVDAAQSLALTFMPEEVAKLDKERPPAAERVPAAADMAPAAAERPGRGAGILRAFGSAELEALSVVMDELYDASSSAQKDERLASIVRALMEVRLSIWAQAAPSAA